MFLQQFSVSGLKIVPDLKFFFLSFPAQPKIRWGDFPIYQKGETEETTRTTRKQMLFKKNKKKKTKNALKTQFYH